MFTPTSKYGVDAQTIAGSGCTSKKKSKTKTCFIASSRFSSPSAVARTPPVFVTLYYLFTIQIIPTPLPGHRQPVESRASTTAALTPLQCLRLLISFDILLARLLLLLLPGPYIVAREIFGAGFSRGMKSPKKR